MVVGDDESPASALKNSGLSKYFRSRVSVSQLKGVNARGSLYQKAYLKY